MRKALKQAVGGGSRNGGDPVSTVTSFAIRLWDLQSEKGQTSQTK